MEQLELECKIKCLENRIEQLQTDMECKDRTIWNMQVDIRDMQARLDKQHEILAVIAGIFGKQEKISGAVIDTLRNLARKSS